MNFASSCLPVLIYCVLGAPLGQYILRRILISIPVLLIITFAIYVLIDLAPGDPMDFFINPELGVTEENLTRLPRAVWP